MLMDAVDAGLGGTLQPWAGGEPLPRCGRALPLSEMADPQARRRNSLCSLSDDELSPAGLAARVVLADCARELVRRRPLGRRARLEPSRIVMAGDAGSASLPRARGA